MFSPSLPLLVAAALPLLLVSCGVKQTPTLPDPQEIVVPQAITARSWAMADAATGNIIAAKDLDIPRKSASITKTMATLVVLRLIDEDPEVLNEYVVFSPTAAATTGSRTDLAEGESMRVEELLYAFMLPSGNDAGNAIAEHFNDRFPEAAEGMGGTTASRRNFVGEMNRVAQEFGMKDTLYRISYGDGGGPEETTTSAADLMILAREAMKHPRMRDVVGTAEFTGTVFRPDGSTYEKTWTNTNRFLSEPGFIGIKTGTTRIAGACLLTAYRQDNREVYIVVLGSETSDQRYDDTRRILELHWYREKQNDL